MEPTQVAGPARPLDDDPSRVGAEADRDRLSIWFGDTLVAKEGEMATGYVEADAAAHMKQDEVTVRIDLGLGNGAATVWTCDLTAQYIAINADYRS